MRIKANSSDGLVSSEHVVKFNIYAPARDTIFGNFVCGLNEYWTRIFVDDGLPGVGRQ